MHFRKPAKDPDNYDDSEVLRMLRNSSINDSGLTSRFADNDIDGNYKFGCLLIRYYF